MRVLVIAVFAALCGPLSAQTRADAEAVSDAYGAYRAGNIDVAREAATRAGVSTLIDWQRLRDGVGSFDDYVAFLEDHPDWPDRDVVRLKAELVLGSAVSDAELEEFFADAPPETGRGVLRYAGVLPEDEAEALVVEAWTTFALSAGSFSAFMGAYPDWLEDHHEARLDMLLWRGRFTDAQRLFSVLDDDQVAMARARIALRRQTGDRAALLDAVPDDLKNHPGIAFEQFLAAFEANRRQEAIAIILEQSGSAEELGNPQSWASARRTLARWLMRNGDASRAYVVASTHHLDGSHARTDLEWLSGYLALRKLGGETQALEHFRTLTDSATTPISMGRAHYWFGRALEEMGLEAAAQTAYVEGGQYQTSFYGLLAAERAGLPMDPALTGRSDADWRDADWAEDEAVRAAILLSAAGERSLAEVFFLDIAEEMEVDDLLLLSDLLSDLRASHVAVRVGKSVAERGIVLPEIYFALHPLARRDMAIDPALALAIARRESEFDPVVTSPVGAQGLMQLMPATAREVSGWLGLRYTRDRLTREADYNAALGVRYLEHLQDRLGLTPAMIAAGYNAGPGRPLIWSDDFGDPRTGEVDIIDWIEHIPFRETRNYVMRVTESIPVYRARLSGEVEPIRFTALLIGQKPSIRPELRPAALDTANRSAPPVQILSSADVEPDAVARADATDDAVATGDGGLQDVIQTDGASANDIAIDPQMTVPDDAVTSATGPAQEDVPAQDPDRDAQIAADASASETDTSETDVAALASAPSETTDAPPVILVESPTAVSLSLRPTTRPDTETETAVEPRRSPAAPPAPASIERVSPLPRPGG